MVNTGLALAGKALTPSSDQEEVSPWTIPLFVLFGIACFLVYKSDRKSRQRYAVSGGASARRLAACAEG